MVGMYAYLPNEEGLTWFTQNVLPEIVTRFPDVELHAVGRYTNQSLDKLGKAVKMRGFVDGLRDEYIRADVVICPIRSGSGTQIKVVEALMSGRPTVVSDFSYQGFSDVLEPDNHLLVARDPQEWVKHIIAVLRDPAAFSNMAQNGRKVAEMAYSLDAFSERVTETLKHSGGKAEISHDA